MDLYKDDTIPWAEADTDSFVGAAWTKRVAAVQEDPSVKVYRVRFAPRARTHWHAHSGAQVLFIIEGRCRVQTWGEELQEAGPGDTVYIAPDEKHWHGGAPGADMVHIAVNIDAATTWMEPVSDAQYEGK